MWRRVGIGILWASLSGCASFSTEYVVKLSGNETVVYKPGTAFSNEPDGVVQLRIPWLKIDGCSSQRIDYSVNTFSAAAAPSPGRVNVPIAWQVASDPFFGTTVRFHPASLDQLQKSERTLAILRKGIPTHEPGCRISLRSDVPASTQSVVGTDDKRARSLLDLLIAERLPTSASGSWVDQYDFDAETRSMNILPGMRVRVHHETPITADPDSSPDVAHPGTLSAPVYFELSGSDASAPGSGRWSTSLGKLGFDAAQGARRAGARGESNAASSTVAARTASTLLLQSASGLPDLGSDSRYWRLFVPTALKPSIVVAPDEHTNVASVSERFFRHEVGYPGFTLVGAMGADGLERLLRQLESNGSYPDLDTACIMFSADLKCLLFRFRGLLVPEIPVTVNGQPVWVEVGTSVFDLVQRNSSKRLQGLLSSPLARAESQRARDSIEADLLSERRNHVLRGALKGMKVLRRFDAGLVQLRVADGTDTSLMGVVLQMGDEISWSR